MNIKGKRMKRDPFILFCVLGPVPGSGWLCAERIRKVLNVHHAISSHLIPYIFSMYGISLFLSTSLFETHPYNFTHMNRKSQTHQTSFLSFRYYCLIKYLLNLSRFCNNVQIMHSLRHGRNAGCNGVLPLTNMFTRYHSYPALRFIPSLQLTKEKAFIFIIYFKIFNKIIQ